MMLRVITAVIFLFTACSNGFTQNLKGEKDGIHKEYHKNGKLKCEYQVEANQLNGFYEKYDENVELEYRQYYFHGIFDGVDRNNYYYPLFFWFQHIDDEGEDVFLNDYEAVKMFSEGYELADSPKEGNWMGIVRTRIPVGKSARICIFSGTVLRCILSNR